MDLIIIVYLFGMGVLDVYLLSFFFCANLMLWHLQYICASFFLCSSRYYLVLISLLWNFFMSSGQYFWTLLLDENLSWYLGTQTSYWSKTGEFSVCQLKKVNNNKISSQNNAQDDMNKFMETKNILFLFYPISSPY